jgi:isoleucyl-tRNA synthetase
VDRAFAPLPAAPDHAALELEMLDRWEHERTFERLRELNRGGPRWSFIDGPITANKVMGVHHMWGRTLKDVFVRYKAQRGFDQRYQNGFDCQGLWIEVGVERELGLNSKREIEEFGLAEFARRCREKVRWSASEITRQSKRLGQWMDWGNDYFTFSDTNIEYIWRFLRIVHERGWLYLGHRSTEWCPRCGTSISQHELHSGDVYREKADPSLFVRFPLLDRVAESLVIWTTTPWTLPANVAAAVRPDAEYGRTRDGEWYAVALFPDEDYMERVHGSELVGLRYQGPYDHLPPAQGVEHRVIPWDEVTLDEGTGIVHIAPGCGGEDFELSKLHELPVLAPVDEAGRFYADYGWLHGESAHAAADQIVGDLRERGLLVEAGLYEHRYPHCWRCETPLIFRLTDDWFIAVDEVRPRLLEANASVTWVPDYFGKRMDDWLQNMGDWNISRRRYYGLPLPIYPCSCGQVTVVGSREELAELAVRGLEQLEELHRPWIDEVVIRCPACSAEVRRIPEVGDVWLDAGIVPLSTLGWQSPEWIEGGYATGASRGLSGADLPDDAYWEQWFPADWVSEMREQIRLWFYSQLFMSVSLVGVAPFRSVLGYEKMLDEHGREMHGSLGNAIEADEAFERMGADVMRRLYCRQPPTQNLRFGFGPAEQVKGELRRFWNCAKFLVDYASIEEFRPTWEEIARGPRGELQPLDRWLVARSQQLVRRATAAYDEYLTHRVVESFDEYVDDLSNWYVRRSRRRFYGDDEAAFATLWYALVQALRVIAPVMPFLADWLWRILVADACEGVPDSVHLAGWPEAAEPDEALLQEVAAARAVVELGHQARGEAGIKLRQPLRRMFVRGAAGGARLHTEEIAAELAVEEVLFDEGPVAQVEVKPNLRLLGPRLGPKLPQVREALAAGDFEELEGGGVLAAGVELSEPEVLRGERVAVDGFAMAASGPLSVALDTALDDQLLRDGRAREWSRRINLRRKELGLELTDRVVVMLPGSEADLLPTHGSWIEHETLAVELRADGDSLEVEKA